MKIKALIICGLASMFIGCGMGQAFYTGVVSGKVVEEVETKRLICAVVEFGAHVSIDCVRKEN